MKKVLFVATVVKTHIMEFHVPYLKMFKEKGWETSVAARNDYENPADCMIPYCDYYYDIPFERYPLSLKNIRAYRSLKRIIDDGHYDIIHCHTPVGAALTRLAAITARKKGTNVIYTAHGFHFYNGAPLKNWLVYFPVEWICAYWTDTIITINNEDYKRAKRCFHAKRVEYVPGVGIDVRHFAETKIDRAAKRRELGVPSDAVLLLSVGELNENKNHSTVIRALGKMNNPNIHYAIAGRGPLLNYLISLATELGVLDQVHILGYRTDVAELYKAADIFVHPSKREGLPVVVIEAMAAGLPIVASRIRGVIDLLNDSENPLIRHSKDVDTYVDILKQLADSKLLREHIKQTNQNNAAIFDVSRITILLKKIYNNIE